MTVTSVTAVAVALRLEASNTSSTSLNTPPAPVTAPADTVEISQQAVAEARTLSPETRAEVLLNKLDTDHDGVVSKSEFTDGAMALLKRASVQFHHHHVGKGEGIAKRDERWTDRLGEVFAKVDANHDGAIDRTELDAALPASPSTTTTTVTVAAVAIREYTLTTGVKRS